MPEHWTVVPDRPTDSTADTRYVKGDIRYMKIQKPGRAVGDTKTLKLKVRNITHLTSGNNLPAEHQA
jgi:hypothetical protein